MLWPILAPAEVFPTRPTGSERKYFGRHQECEQRDRREHGGATHSVMCNRSSVPFSAVTLASKIVHHTQPGNERIVLLHGFTQNADCWEPFATLLGQQTGMEIMAIDAPGHGLSPAQHDTADLWESAALIAEVGGAAHYVGYSMGGRMALHVALSQPAAVSSLTLISATPGIADSTERAARLAADSALADRLEAIGVAAFVDEWLAMPMFRGLNNITAHRTARLRNRADGLAASLRRCGTGAQEDLRPRLVSVLTPTFVVVGHEDAKFAAIARDLPGETHCIDGAGHTAHLERPNLTAHAVSGFIRSISFLTAK